MRSVYSRRSLATLTLVALIPLFGGCSLFGIATSKDLAETEGQLQMDSQRTTSRLDRVEQVATESQAGLTAMSTDVDSLRLMFGQALDWLRAIDFEGMSKQASDASAAAAAIEEQNRAFMNKYVEWLRVQQDLISEQIETIESRMPAAEPSSDPEEAPAEDE